MGLKIRPKTSVKIAQIRVYKATKNAPRSFDLERQYLKNYLLYKNAQLLIESVFSIPFYQVLGHFCCFSGSRSKKICVFLNNYKKSCYL